ncbi:MAG: hypothetical protein ABSG58_01710 [Acidimicrobiales bacterium]
MTDATSNANTVMRAALLKMDVDHVLGVVDTLDLRANAKVSAVVGVPLRQLQQRRDVEAFAVSAPVAAVRGLLEVIALPPLEKIIELLGDHAENPSYERLAGAIDEFLRSGGSVDDALSVLAFAVGDNFPAAPHCRRLLAEREEFALPEIPDAQANSVLAPPREVRPEIREQRKQRREEEKRKKKALSPSRVPSRAHPKNTATVRPGAPAAPTPPSVPEVRRRAILTPLEESRFDPDHPLAGSLVLVDVPFDAVDPAQPEVTSKERPAIVVAASTEELLVRPLYSQDAVTRSVFSPWRRVGLDHVSYIDDARVIVIQASDTARPLAQLTVAEWNSLF